MKKETMGYVLWTIQIILAALFLFSGATKLMMSDEALTAQSTLLPALFLRFIGVCEILGAIGLIIPMALDIKPMLTPIAALGLTIMMIGAVVITIATVSVAMAAIPLIVGLLAAFVATKRWKQMMN